MSDKKVNERSENNRRKRNFTLDFKQRVVEFANLTNNKKAAEKFGVSRQCVQQWKSVKDELDNAAINGCANKRRLEGAGRHVKDKNADEELAEWIRDKRRRKLRVTRLMIQQQARQTLRFKASNGWLECFLKRHGFTSRRPATVCQKPEEELMQKVVSFFLEQEKEKERESGQHEVEDDKDCSIDIIE